MVNLSPLNIAHSINLISFKCFLWLLNTDIPRIELIKDLCTNFGQICEILLSVGLGTLCVNLIKFSNNSSYYSIISRGEKLYISRAGRDTFFRLPTPVKKIYFRHFPAKPKKIGLQGQKFQKKKTFLKR